MITFALATDEHNDECPQVGRELSPGLRAAVVLREEGTYIGSAMFVI